MEDEIVEVQEDNRTKVSFSQYTVWANCPEAWRLKYVENHRLDESSIHTVFGTAMHETIQEWLDILFNKSETVARSIELDESLKTKLTEEFKKNTTTVDGQKVFPSDRATLEEFYHQGTQILSYLQSNHKKFFPTYKTKLVAVEFPIDKEVRNGVWFIAYLDIVTYDESNGLYTIYDLKTSTKGWSDYQKRDKVKTSQLLLYKKFLAEHFGVPLDRVKVEYVILKRIISESSPYPIPRISSFEPSNGKPSVSAAWEGFEAFLNDCFDENGNKKTDTIKHKASKSACKFCVYKTRKDLCQYGVEG